MSQSADHLGHNGCFVVVFVEVVCVLGACCCRRPTSDRVGAPVEPAGSLHKVRT